MKAGFEVLNLRQPVLRAMWPKSVRLQSNQRLQQNLAVFPLGKEALSGDETKRKEDRMPMSIAALAKS